MGFPGNEDPFINGQRDMVTHIGNKVRDRYETPNTVDELARRRWPHWWQRRLRHEWAEGHRLAVAWISNDIWHSMP